MKNQYLQPFIWQGFSHQKSRFGKILEGLAMEDFVMFYGHLVHIHILWLFGIFYVYLVYFPVLVYSRKIWQPFI
jgi:hypothetical protein